MMDMQIDDLSSLPSQFSYLLTAMDQYYGLPVWKNEKTRIYKGNAPKRLKYNKKLRILITTFWDYPAVGGLQKYIAALKAGLEKLGHHVDVFAPNHFPKKVKRKLHSKISKYFTQYLLDRYGSVNKNILNNLCNLSLYKIMMEALDLHQYDLIHAQDRFTCNVTGIVNKSYEIPLLFTPHGFMTHNKLKFKLLKKGSIEEAYYSTIDKQAVKNANHVINLCEAFRPLLKKLGADDNRMTTVYTGIDFKAESDQNGHEKTIITCVSRLRPRKGHKYLFDALALIKDELKNVEVRIVGDGEMREILEKQVKKLNLKNVFFLGRRNDIPQLLSQSDIFVLPTTSDTLPISIIEAMLAGQAILTTNIGGIPEIIQENRTGLIAQPGSTEQLAEKLLLLLRNKSLRIKLASQAKSYANEHLTVDSMVKEIVEIYQSLN
ncbi:glycosyltransferase family 4 protein [Neobacillus sp. NRS-1170]|uniref:glycosyltransferase family 4 protein n=1 Tax=Neobacillus sp. NRS-1170 TaxID=3233898 RepID=UPI003D2E6607